MQYNVFVKRTFVFSTQEIKFSFEIFVDILVILGLFIYVKLGL